MSKKCPDCGEPEAGFIITFHNGFRWIDLVQRKKCKRVYAITSELMEKGK